MRSGDGEQDGEKREGQFPKLVSQQYKAPICSKKYHKYHIMFERQDVPNNDRHNAHAKQMVQVGSSQDVTPRLPTELLTTLHRGRQKETGLRLVVAGGRASRHGG